MAETRDSDKPVQKQDAPKEPQRPTGVHGQTQMDVGTGVYRTPELQREFQSSAAVADDTPQARVGGTLDATARVGREGTITGGVTAHVTGGLPSGGGIMETVDASAHAELRDTGFVHSARAFGYAETGRNDAPHDYATTMAHADFRSGGVRKSVGVGESHTGHGGGVEVETKEARISDGVTISASGGARVDVRSTDFDPTTGHNKTISSNTVDVMAHVEATVHAGPVDATAGVADGVRVQGDRWRTGFGFSENPDRDPALQEQYEQWARNGYEIGKEGFVSRGGTQVMVGLGADIGERTRIDSKFYVTVFDPAPPPQDPNTIHLGGTPPPAPPKAGSEMEDRAYLDVTHRFSDKVSGTASALVSEHVQGGTLGVKVEDKSKKDFSFFFSGEAGAVHYNAPRDNWHDRAGPSGTQPVARATVGFKF